MKSSAIKYRVLDKTGKECCVVAVKFGTNESSSQALERANKFVNELDYPNHNDAVLEECGREEIDFSDGLDVRLYCYVPNVDK